MKVILCAAFTFFFLCTQAYELKILKNVGPLVIVELPINGKLHKFLLDSGSNANFINAKSYENLKDSLVRTPNQDKYINTFGGKQISPAFKWSFKLDGFSYDGMESFVMNTEKFNEKNDGIKCCDGILGIDFLKKYPVHVDIKNKKVRILNSIKSKGYEALKIQLKGKNVPIFSCKSNGRNYKFRLDSGSEVPLIFHTHAVDKYMLREQMFSQGFMGNGLPFFNMRDLNCEGISFKKLIGTYYYGSTGALSHKFVDANVGAYLLGNDYIFNFSNNQIFIKNDSSMPFKYAGKKYEFKANYKHVMNDNSIILQAQALMINSCSEKSDFQHCIKKFCSLTKKKMCVFKETRQVIKDFVKFLFPLDSKDCSVQRVVNELREKPVRYNYCWHKLSEINQTSYPKKNIEVNVPSSFARFNLDISILEVSNPVELTKNFYCYSVYEGIISQSSLPASLFGLSIKGLSLSNKNIGNYLQWLESKDGLACQSELAKTIPSGAGKNLGSYFKSKYLAIVNPLTLLGDGVRSYEQLLNVTLNHEILHALYASSNKYRQLSKAAWGKLDNAQREKFIKSHPSYNLKNKDILYKEYFAYSYENKPEQLKALK